MDQNHAPPSPLQQHRPSSSRHANQGSTNAQASSSIDNKLKNPVGLHRQSGATCASPTSAQASLTPWSGAQEPSSSSSSSNPNQPSTMAWSQESEEAAVSSSSSTSTSTSGTMTWDNTNTQPLASSSRCPSPHHITMDMPSTTNDLAFRPVNLPYEIPTKPAYAEILTGGKTPVVDPRASNFVADMYWDTLREILVSLMGSTTPCPNHFAHSFSKEALEAHEAVCPTVTHALVPELYAALDPEFLTIQARRGVFDLQLFAKLGEAMKVHCAPVRDEMVDDMVRTALSGDVAKGLRKCFDCAEVMKLDIANHQPYLWDNANQYEYNAFQALLAQNKVTLETSKTRQWINAASRQVLSAAEPRLRTHLIGRCDCKNNMELVIRSLTSGFLDLVCGPWDRDRTSWPPIVSRRALGCNGIPVLDGLSKPSVDVPEAFKMDSRRLREFHAEVVDIAISHMILLAFRNYFNQYNGKVSAEVLRLNLDKARKDIEWMNDNFSVIGPTCGSDADLAFQLASRIVRPESPNSSSEETARGLPSTKEMKLISNLTSTFTEFFEINFSRDSDLFIGNLNRLKNFLNKILSDVLLGYRLNPTSTFFDSNVNKCLEKKSNTSTNISTVTVIDGLEVAKDEDNEIKSYPREIRERYKLFLSKCKQEESDMIKSFGFEGVIEPIKDLTERMIKIVAFNLSVFGENYASNGILVGSDRK
ncbi:hypothetical protein V865_006180 [Kwoniella europaea PYCC6329]|uniref:Uncharacterized protein n=1 Tax=Kwoniella europaea PYCC6329 TaxID=1423913 RepID=A0AAX4KR70_9TREE